MENLWKRTEIHANVVVGLVLGFHLPVPLEGPTVRSHNRVPP